MKSLGIVRRIDEVGRIVLPKELRREFDLRDSEDAVEIFVHEDQIILKKYAPACSFCKSADNLVEYMDRKVCKHCVESLQMLANAKEDV